jgi:predicted transcriptional regulator
MTTKETKVKKRKSRDKKPVLTSPWKIGIFVSLLLVLMSLGVGYYLVSFYDVDLKWLTSGSNGWSIDSTLFARDMLPLAAAVIFVSLFAYFLIASAVHRYKFYLDSGQDYRTMISLAESIDDLTNPAQIARLSQYPELQAVLRNYGDQIREISRDLGTRENASNYSELKSEIESLIDVENADGESSEGKECNEIYEKLRERIEADRTHIEELEKRNEGERRAYAQAALAYGRAMEAISGAGEELLAITNSAAELTSVAERMNANAPRGVRPRGAAVPQNAGLKTTVSEMESSVRTLEEGGRALHEFSEENNGIAIHLALMAARGNVDEHALATFAERVRSTAERFHKLSDTVSGIAQSLLGSCYDLKDRSGADAVPADPSIDAEASGAIVDIARRINEQSAALEKRIMGLGSELHEVHELLQKDAAGAVSPEPVPEPGPAQVAARDTGDSSEMVIDHGSSWNGMKAEEEVPEAAEDAAGEEEGFSFDNIEEMKKAFADAVPKQDGKEKASDFSNMSSLRHLDEEAEAHPEPAVDEKDTTSLADGGEEDARQWRTVEVDKSEVEEEAGPVDVKVEAAPPAAPRDESEAVIETVAEAPLGAADRAHDDDEPIYDLLDLGAVEYVKESQIQR